jgi:hypothetical protein
MIEDRNESSSQLKFRLKSSLRAALEKAAEENGRSLNAEISDRLQRSFDQSRPWDRSDDEATKGIATMLAAFIGQVGAVAGTLAAQSAEGARSWHENPYAYDQVCKAVETVMERLRPAGNIEAPPSDQPGNDAFFAGIGRSFARTTLNKIHDLTEQPTSSEPVVNPAQEEVRRLGHALGPLVERLRPSPFIQTPIIHHADEKEDRS